MSRVDEQRSDGLKRFIRDIPDFPKPGILFRDITPLLNNPSAMGQALAAMEQTARGLDPDLVIGIESRGFLFGVPIAQRLQVGFVPIRKPGKLPWATLEQTYQLEYGSGTLEMHRDAIRPGQRVLIVDDLLATGGTANASVELAHRGGGEVVGALFLVELDDLGGREVLDQVPVFSTIRY